MLCLSVANKYMYNYICKNVSSYKTNSQAGDLPKTWSGITNKLANIPPRLQIFIGNPPWIERATETKFTNPQLLITYLDDAIS